METRALTYGQRIWKYRLHYLVVILPLLMILLLKLIPFAGNAYLAFSDFSVYGGLWESPWIGWENFNRLFADPAFLSALRNTLVIKIGYIALSGALSFGVALALSGIGSAKMRNFFSTLFLLPFFIPSIVVAYVVMQILSPGESPFPVDTLVLAEPGWIRLLIVIAETLKTCGIPILIALAAVMRADPLTSLAWTQKAAAASRAVAAFLVLQLSTLLSTDFELIFPLNSPMLYETGDTLNTYMFRIGFMNMGVGLSSAAWLFQFVVQLLATAVAYLAIRRFLFRDLFGPRQSMEEENAPPKRSTGIAGLLTAAVYAAAILFPLYLLFISPFFSGPGGARSGLKDLLPADLLMIYLRGYLGVVIVNLMLTLTLAYPLTVRDLPGRTLYKGFLLLMMVIGQASFSEYLMVRELGLTDTIFAPFLSGLTSIVSIFVLKSVFNARHAAAREKASAEGRGEGYIFWYLYVANVWKPLLALGILQFVYLWGSYYDSLLYLASPERYSPAATMLRLASGGGESGLLPGDPTVMMYAAMISLPPVILLLVFRKLLTSEALLSQIRRL